MTTKSRLKKYLIITDGPGEYQVFIGSLPSSKNPTSTFILRQNKPESQPVTTKLKITGIKHSFKHTLMEHPVFEYNNQKNIIFISGEAKLNTVEYYELGCGPSSNNQIKFTALYDFKKRCGILSFIDPQRPKIQITIPDEYPDLPIFPHNFNLVTNVNEMDYIWGREVKIRLMEFTINSDIAEISKKFILFLEDQTPYCQKTTITITHADHLSIGKQIYEDLSKIDLIGNFSKIFNGKKEIELEKHRNKTYSFSIIDNDTEKIIEKKRTINFNTTVKKIVMDTSLTID